MNKLLLVLLFILIAPIVKIHAASYTIDNIVSVNDSDCSYTLDIFIDTEGKNSNAADLIVKYNLIEATILDADPLVDGVQIITGNAYESYVYNKVEETQIKITAVRFDSINGRYLFARIPFVAHTKNPVFQIQFDGVGNTYDSNIAELTTSLDLLTSVHDLPIQTPNYQCSLTPNQINNIVLPVKDSSETPTSIETIIFFTVFVLLLLLAIILLVNKLLLTKKIIVENSETHQPLSGTTILLPENSQYIITDKKGQFRVSRRHLRKKMIISKQDYREKVLESGVGSNNKLLLSPY